MKIMNLNAWIVLEMWHSLQFSFCKRNMSAETWVLTFSSECSEFMSAVTCLHQFYFPLMKSHKSSHLFSSPNQQYIYIYKTQHFRSYGLAYCFYSIQFTRDAIRRRVSLTSMACTGSLATCVTCMVHVKWNLRNERKLMDSPRERKRVHK